MAYRELGIQGGVDHAGAGAIVLAPPDDKDETIGLGNLDQVVPVTSQDELGRHGWAHVVARDGAWMRPHGPLGE